MLSPIHSETFAAKLRKDVRPSLAAQIALPLAALRKLETGLHHRKLLSLPQSAMPLWFLAETEINVFLWRSGLSLADKDDFDFWIDCEGLAAKRLEQLAANSPENPFTSPGSHNEEETYVRTFIRLSLPVLPHIHALFVAASHCLSEERSVVILPAVHPGASPRVTGNTGRE